MTLIRMTLSRVTVMSLMQGVRMCRTRWRVTRVRPARTPWIKMMTVPHLHRRRSVMKYLCFKNHLKLDMTSKLIEDHEYLTSTQRPGSLGIWINGYGYPWRNWQWAMQEKVVEFATNTHTFVANSITLFCFVIAAFDSLFPLKVHCITYKLLITILFRVWFGYPLNNIISIIILLIITMQ